MPRDVRLGEGYDGEMQLASHSPGHHNGEFWVDDGSRTLMQVGDIPDQGYFGVGNSDKHEFDRGDFDRQRWAMGGMGDLAAEWAQLLAKGSLDQLRDALGKVVNQLITLGAYRKEVFNGYATAAMLQAEAVKLAGSLTISLPFMGTIPNPSVIPAIKAFQTSVQAVRMLARLVHQTAQLQIVFMKIGEQLFVSGLKTDADMVATSLYPVSRFITETSTMFAVVPEYAKATQELVQVTTAERNAWGVSLNDYLDPRWYEAYMKGADKVIPLPKAAVGGVGGMGDLALGPLVIISIAAGITILVSGIIAVVRLMPDANANAKASLELLKQAQARKAAVEAQMRAQGKSQVEIDAAKDSIDKDTAKSVETLPPPTSFLSGVIGPLGLVAAALVAGVVLNK